MPDIAPGDDASETGEPGRPTLVVLVRHGVTAHTTAQVLTGRTPGVDLSDDGRRQADAAADRLAPLPVTCVYSSPIERTSQTARSIAARHGLAVRDLPGVVEVDYGEWSGRTIAELTKLPLWRTVQNAPSRVRFPAGETLIHMAGRVVEALDRVAEDHPGEVVVVVSHADPIKAALAHYSGAPFDAFQRFVVAPASISIVSIGPSGGALVLSNHTGDLQTFVPKPRRELEGDAA